MVVALAVPDAEQPLLRVGLRRAPRPRQSGQARDQGDAVQTTRPNAGQVLRAHAAPVLGVGVHDPRLSGGQVDTGQLLVGTGRWPLARTFAPVVYGW